MKALILSNNSALAAKARLIWQRVNQQLDENICWIGKAWPHNALPYTSRPERALLEGVEPHST